MCQSRPRGEVPWEGSNDQMKIKAYNPKSGKPFEVEASGFDEPGAIEYFNSFDLTMEDLVRRIGGLPLSAEAKKMLLDFSSTKVWADANAIWIGRKILEKFLELVRHNPHASAGAILKAVIVRLTTNIPILAHLLEPIISPLYAARGPAHGESAEFKIPQLKRFWELMLPFDKLQGQESSGDDRKARFDALDIDSVIRDEWLFTGKLGIDLDCTSLSEALLTTKGAVSAASAGAAVASSSIVATTFFPAGGVLGALGLATAATPVGWIVLAAAASGVGYTLARKKAELNRGRDEAKPRIVNSPIDQLAVEVFDLLAPMALKIAGADGEFHEAELRTTKEYFSELWGYEPAFVDLALECVKEDLEMFRTEDVARTFAELSRNSSDYKYRATTGNLIEFLKEVIMADGVAKQSEKRELKRIQEIFDGMASQRSAPVKPRFRHSRTPFT